MGNAERTYDKAAQERFDAMFELQCAAGIGEEMARQQAHWAAIKSKPPKISPIRKRHGRDDAPHELPQHVTALGLMEREMPPIARLNDPFIAEGLNGFAGRPKLGKSTMVRQKLAAIGGGGEFFDLHVYSRPPCFLSLEEGDR